VTALLLGFPLILFLGALLADLAYFRTQEIQWVNFAAWLNAGALLCGGIVLGKAIIDLFRRRDDQRSPMFLLLLAAMWIVGLANALVHTRDGWASMPMGLILSLVVAVLAIAAAWAALHRPRQAEQN
jgi:uncharacterized membrane protein